MSRFFLLLLLSSASLAHAEDPPPPKPPDPKKTQTLEDVVVRGQREEPGAGRADPITFATVLRPDEERHRAITLADLLRQSVGVDVKGFGGLGGFATVSVRGSTSEQVQIFLDGVLLNRASSGSVNLADIPLGQIERIEVYRGFSPAGFGAAAPGGVIQLVTKTGGATPRTTFEASFGSYETFEFNGSHSGPHPFGDYLFSVNVLRSAGSFTFLDNNGTPLNPSDDETTRRRNNEQGSVGGLGKATFKVGSASLRVLVEGMARTQGVPGIDALQTQRAGFDSSRILGKLDYENPRLAPGVSLALSAFSTRTEDAFHDPRGELGLGPHETTTVTTTPGATARLRAVPNPTHVLSALVEYRHDDARSVSVGLARTTAISLHRDSVAVTAEDQLSFFGDRLLLNPSLRMDAVLSRASAGGPPATDDVEVSGKVGIKATLTPGFAFRANAGRFFRAPTLTELFGDTGLVRGNPLLRPEVGYAFDAGFTFSSRAPGVRRIFAEAVYFENHLSDLILLVLNAQGVATADNLAAALIRGVEVQTAFELELGATFSLAYTWQEARSDADDPTSGKLLPGRPQHKLNARLGYNRGDWRVFYELLVISGNYIDRFERLELDARVLHGAGVSWRMAKELTLSAELQNFTDNRAVDLYRFPLPGRSFFAKLSAQF